jgi:very-long-chain (3R)-3-hydroxyacyl-CoA dehydratase
MTKLRYLKIYNLTSLILWVVLAIFFRATSCDATQNWWYALLFVQGLAVFEVLHISLGWVKTPMMTTLVQYISRMFITGVLFVTNIQWGLSNDWWIATGTLIIFLAWPAAEVIRYAFYLLPSNSLIRWLRYSAFMLLYPTGVTAEFFLMGKSMKVAIGQQNYAWAGLMAFAFLMYVVFFPKLFGYLWKQRNAKL